MRFSEWRLVSSMTPPFLAYYHLPSLAITAIQSSLIYDFSTSSYLSKLFPVSRCRCYLYTTRKQQLLPDLHSLSLNGVYPVCTGRSLQLVWHDIMMALIIDPTNAVIVDIQRYRRAYVLAAVALFGGMLSGQCDTGMRGGILTLPDF